MLHSFVHLASNEEELSETLPPAQYLLDKKALEMVWTIRIRTAVLPFLQSNPTHVTRSKSLYRLSCPPLFEIDKRHSTQFIWPWQGTSIKRRLVSLFLQRHKSGFWNWALYTFFKVRIFAADVIIDYKLPCVLVVYGFSTVTSWRFSWRGFKSTPSENPVALLRVWNTKGSIQY